MSVETILRTDQIWRWLLSSLRLNDLHLKFDFLYFHQIMVLGLYYFTFSLTLHRKLSPAMLRGSTISISFMLFSQHFVLIVYFFNVRSGVHAVGHLQVIGTHSWFSLAQKVNLFYATWGIDEALPFVKCELLGTTFKKRLTPTIRTSSDTHGSLRNSSTQIWTSWPLFQLFLKIIF